MRGLCAFERPGECSLYGWLFERSLPLRMWQLWAHMQGQLLGACKWLFAHSSLAESPQLWPQTLASGTVICATLGASPAGTAWHRILFHVLLYWLSSSWHPSRRAGQAQGKLQSIRPALSHTEENESEPRVQSGCESRLPVSFSCKTDSGNLGRALLPKSSAKS